MYGVEGEAATDISAPMGSSISIDKRAALAGARAEGSSRISIGGTSLWGLSTTLVLHFIVAFVH